MRCPKRAVLLLEVLDRRGRLGAHLESRRACLRCRQRAGDGMSASIVSLPMLEAHVLSSCPDAIPLLHCRDRRHLNSRHEGGPRRIAIGKCCPSRADVFREGLLTRIKRAVLPRVPARHVAVGRSVRGRKGQKGWRDVGAHARRTVQPRACRRRGWCQRQT